MAIEVTMEIETPTKKEFMAKFDRYEPVIRGSTAIKKVKTCPRLYFYEIVLGRTSPEKAIYFAWGSAYHKFREILEIAYGYGHAAPARYDEAKGVEAFGEALKVAIAYWKKHGKDQEVGTKFEFMTTERLQQTCVIAYKHWAKEKLQGRIQVIAVEQSFNVELSDGSRTNGKADQIVKWNGRLWGRDFKTTSKSTDFYSRSLEPNDQFTRYTFCESKLAGEQIQGQLVEVMYNAKHTKNKKHGPEIVEFTTSRTPRQLDTFEKEQIFNNKLLKLMRDEDTYPMFEVACPFCPFHSVCTKASEGAMMAHLEQYFVVRPWDNTSINED